MTDDTTTTIPSIEDWQHWALVMARANQMIMEAWADNLAKGKTMHSFGLPVPHATNDPMSWMTAGAEAWARGLEAWSNVLGHYAAAGEAKDRRFASPEWREDPIFDTVRQSYLAISEKLLGTVEDIEGLDEAARNRLRFATQNFVDAMSPANFVATNPEVMKRTIETKGENLLSGLKNMLDDITKGQVTQSPEGAFELGRDLATTPGKVIYETKLFQLIQYTPTSDKVAAEPLLYVPPLVNRFYMIDLVPRQSLVKWLVDEGRTVFVISWVNPGEQHKDKGVGDYVLDGIVEAIGQVRQRREAPVPGQPLEQRVAGQVQRGSAEDGDDARRGGVIRMHQHQFVGHRAHDDAGDDQQVDIGVGDARQPPRILGMGDVVSLVEKAQETIKAEEAEALARKMAKGQFDLNDLRGQLQQMQRMGGIGALAGMLPGLGKMKNQINQSGVLEGNVLGRLDAIIGSMTPKERAKPDLMNAKRKIRIAKGSGTTVQEVNKLLKMHLEMSNAMKRLKKLGGFGKLASMFNKGGMEQALGGLAPGGQLPGGMPGLPGGASPFNLPPGFDKFGKK